MENRANPRAHTNNSVKIQNQARRAWAALVGRSTPKNTYEVGDWEEGGGEDRERVRRVEHFDNGEGVVAVGAPVALLLLLKLNSGREVSPGQSAFDPQGEHAGTEPTVKAGQPKQDTLLPRDSKSLALFEKEEGRRGGGQVKALQSLSVEAVGEEGCFPGEQVKGIARHWVSCIAPVVAVVFPGGHFRHCEDMVAPEAELYFPKSHSVGVEEEGPLYAPGGVGVHSGEPAWEE